MITEEIKNRVLDKIKNLGVDEIEEYFDVMIRAMIFDATKQEQMTETEYHDLCASISDDVFGRIYDYFENYN